MWRRWTWGGTGWKIKGVDPKVSAALFSSFCPSQRQAAKLTPLIQFFVLMRQTLSYQAYDVSMIATEREIVERFLYKYFSLSFVKCLLQYENHNE